MFEAYTQQARVEALELIAKGYDVASLVHLVKYPTSCYLYETEYMYLSTPLDPDTDLSGYTSIYYTLGELAYPENEEEHAK